MPTLAEVVTEIMKSSRVSGYDVEQRSEKKIRQSSVYRIAKGVIVSPSPETLRNLALGLGVPPETLLSAAYAADDEGNDLTIAAITNYCNNLPESVREDVLVICKALFEKHGKG